MDEKNLDTVIKLQEASLYEKVNDLLNDYINNPNDGTAENIHYLIEQNPKVFDKKFVKKFQEIQKMLTTQKIEDIFKAKQDQFKVMADIQIKKIKLMGEGFLEEQKEKHKQRLELELKEQKGIRNEEIEKEIALKSAEYMTELTRRVLTLISEFSDNINNIRLNYAEKYIENLNKLEKFKNLNLELFKDMKKSVDEELNINLENIKNISRKFNEKLMSKIE